MNFIDFHVDTLYRLFYRAKGEVGDLWKNNCHIDLEREIASGLPASSIWRKSLSWAAATRMFWA